MSETINQNKLRIYIPSTLPSKVNVSPQAKDLTRKLDLNEFAIERHERSFGFTGWSPLNEDYIAPQDPQTLAKLEVLYQEKKQLKFQEYLLSVNLAIDPDNPIEIRQTAIKQLATTADSINRHEGQVVKGYLTPQNYDSLLATIEKSMTTLDPNSDTYIILATTFANLKPDPIEVTDDYMALKTNQIMHPLPLEKFVNAQPTK